MVKLYICMWPLDDAKELFNLLFSRVTREKEKNQKAGIELVFNTPANVHILDLKWKTHIADRWMQHLILEFRVPDQMNCGKVWQNHFKHFNLKNGQQKYLSPAVFILDRVSVLFLQSG